MLYQLFPATGVARVVATGRGAFMAEHGSGGAWLACIT